MPSSDREKRLERYRQLSRRADELAYIGKKDEALAILRPAREEAQKAGDEDYRLFFEAEIENCTEPNYDHQIALHKEALQWAERNSPPPDFFLCTNVGAYYGLKGDDDAAIEWYDKALAINPKDYHAMRNRGVSLSKKGDEDAAIEWYDKALAIKPKDYHAMRQRGVSLSEKGDEDAAIEWFDKALAVNPKDSGAMRQRGISLSKKGDEDAAIEWYDKALAINPKDSNAMRDRGAALGKKGYLDAAIECFDEARTINPTDHHAMRNRGVSLSKKGDLDAAIEWYDKALAVNPKDSHAMRERGVAVAKKGDLDASIEWFDKALAVNARDSDAMRNRGGVMADKGNLGAAIEWYDKALVVNPKDSDAMSYLAFSLAALGRKEKAQEWIGKGILHDRVRHWENFSFLCRFWGLDPDREYQSLKEKAAKGKREKELAEPLPKKTREKGEVGEMQAFIEQLREGLAAKAEIYLKQKKEAEEKRQSFLKVDSRLDPNRSILMVLRRWNSYTPGIPSSEDERSRGGGYFLWHRGKGIVIDPGYDFLENLNAAGVRLVDVDSVVVTHAHNDHTMDFETLRTLLNEYNDNEKTKRKKRVHFYLNNGAFMKFAGLIDLRDEAITGSIQTMNPGNRFVLDGGIEMQVLPAYHDEVISRTHAVGLKFAATAEEGKPWRLLFTGDTGLYPLHSVGGRNRSDPKGDEVWKRYGLSDKEPIDVLVVHIGSIKEEELQKRFSPEPGEACYPNHLGIIGTARVITSCRPSLAVVSEFGEEMRDFREPLVRDLPRRVVTPYMQAKMPGVEPPEIVPGDLPFVYDLAEKRFYCCISRKWVDFRRIGFFEVARERGEKVVYFHDRAEEPTEPEKKARSKEFDNARKETFDESLYFKPGAIKA